MKDEVTDADLAEHASHAIQDDDEDDSATVHKMQDIGTAAAKKYSASADDSAAKIDSLDETCAKCEEFEGKLTGKLDTAIEAHEKFEDVESHFIKIMHAKNTFDAKCKKIEAPGAAKAKVLRMIEDAKKTLAAVELGKSVSFAVKLPSTEDVAGMNSGLSDAKAAKGVLTAKEEASKPTCPEVCSEADMRTAGEAKTAADGEVSDANKERDEACAGIDAGGPAKKAKKEISCDDLELDEKKVVSEEDVKYVGVYDQPGLNGGFSCSGENNNLKSIAYHYFTTDPKLKNYKLDRSIKSFDMPDLEAALKKISFFFMTDMERTVKGWDAKSQAIMAKFVRSGGVIVMTGTAGGKDTQFLNDAFGYSTKSVRCHTAKKNDNAIGTSFDGAPTLGCPSATDHINCAADGCTPMYGTAESAAIATFSYGAGTVVYLGYDFFNTGFAVDWGEGMFHNCRSNNNDWVKTQLKSGFFYAEEQVAAIEAKKKECAAAP
jgi:hypothetical protein